MIIIKYFIMFLSAVLIVFSVTGEISNVVQAKTEINKIDEHELEKIDLNLVVNLEYTLNKVGISRANLLNNNYRINKDNVGFINAKDNNDIYYNFYLVGNEIRYYSIQQTKVNGNVTFDLYDLSKNHLLYSELDQNGNKVNEKVYDLNDNGYSSFRSKSTGINKAAFKWACIFSSYLACMGVAGAIGAAGGLVSGPFGLAAGFVGGGACRYIFQTAVEKYGSKERACKILS